jgi:predicted nucleic acid-binding protein
MNANEILTERYFTYDTRRKVRRATGVFVGFFDNEANKVRTGFSRCNVIAGDKFDMHSGVAYAVQQAIFQNVWVKDNDDNQDFWDHYINFVDRCNRYFKQGLADVPANDRDYQGRKDFLTDLFAYSGLGVADKNGMDLLKGFYPNINTSNVHIVKNKEEEVKKAEVLIQKIKDQFKVLGYSEKDISNIINGLGVAGIADAEGIALLKKHFPNIDTSKIEVLAKKEEEKKEPETKKIKDSIDGLMMLIQKVLEERV